MRAAIVILLIGDTSVTNAQAGGAGVHFELDVNTSIISASTGLGEKLGYFAVPKEREIHRLDNRQNPN